MEAAHLGSGNRICTVVFADIVQYTEESVSRQVEMKAAQKDAPVGGQTGATTEPTASP